MNLCACLKKLEFMVPRKSWTIRVFMCSEFVLIPPRRTLRDFFFGLVQRAKFRRQLGKDSLTVKWFSVVRSRPPLWYPDANTAFSTSISATRAARVEPSYLP